MLVSYENVFFQTNWEVQTKPVLNLLSHRTSKSSIYEVYIMQTSLFGVSPRISFNHFKNRLFAILRATANNRIKRIIGIPSWTGGFCLSGGSNTFQKLRRTQFTKLLYINVQSALSYMGIYGFETLLSNSELYHAWGWNRVWDSLQGFIHS